MDKKQPTLRFYLLSGLIAFRVSKSCMRDILFMMEGRTNRSIEMISWMKENPQATEREVMRKACELSEKITN